MAIWQGIAGTFLRMGAAVDTIVVIVATPGLIVRRLLIMSGRTRTPDIVG